MSDQVVRPQGSDKRISAKNEFELCYLRHKYIRRTTNNPTKSEMRPYMDIVYNVSKNTYFTYRSLFRIVGFELDDLVAIGQIHLVSFLGLFSFEQVPEKLKEFEEVFVKKNNALPGRSHIEDKEKANLTIFLKQRMEDVVRICRQKVRNIRGFPIQEYHYYCGPTQPPAILRELLTNYEKLGFKKLDYAVFRSIKKRIKTDGEQVFQHNGLWYVIVPTEFKNNVEVVDFAGAGHDPYDNMHNMTPEEVFFSKEEQSVWKEEEQVLNFDNSENKKKLLTKFIEDNKKNPQYLQEIKVARKMLKEMK